VNYFLIIQHTLTFRTKKSAILTYNLVLIILFTSPIYLETLFRVHDLYSTELHYEYLNES
jgi:hypothetical protein